MQLLYRNWLYAIGHAMAEKPRRLDIRTCVSRVQWLNIYKYIERPVNKNILINTWCGVIIKLYQLKGNTESRWKGVQGGGGGVENKLLELQRNFVMNR